MDHHAITAFAIERHSIYLRRTQGNPRPWTEDPILRFFKFTNIYRELDRTTKWIKANVRDKIEDPYELATAIAVHRWFNRIETCKAILEGWPSYWQTKNLIHLRETILDRRGKGPYCTGAFITKAPAGYNKLDGVLINVHTAAPYLLQVIKDKSLEGAFKTLIQAPYLGRFTAAQLIADMKYTPLLDQAPDWSEWAHSGPGSSRGLSIICGRPPDAYWKEEDWLTMVQNLRNRMMPAFAERYWEIPHAQDVQNMLCEYGKYVRGYSRNNFVPTED